MPCVAEALPTDPESGVLERRPASPAARSIEGSRRPLPLSAEGCVTRQATETRYIKPEFHIVSNEPVTLRCDYCEHEIHPQYIASSKWHQGKLENKQYYYADGSMLKRIHPENLLIFDSEDEALARGFKLGKKDLRE